ncbi:MAG: LLM class flavin-dependent oxidoreductase [Gammaproteobacteria bacterium]|nr:LLM class flavin-dependent oxidoreductase [Gammaproteobacteria bacterium]
MKFGVRLIQHLGSPRDIVDLGILADKAGFDHAWFPSDKFMYHAWSIIAALSEHTENIIVGANGSEPYGISPGETAAFMATLDQLNKGRTAIGYGMHTQKMIEWMGINVDDRITRVREAVELMRKVWRGEIAEFSGQEFQWSDQCYLRFEAYREKIPIYVSGFENDDLALSGEIGDGSLPMVTPPESAKLMVERIVSGIDKAGRDKSEVDICGCAWISMSENGKNTDTDSLKDILAYFGNYLDGEALNTVGLSQKSFAETAKAVEERNYGKARELVTKDMHQLAIVGTPEDAIKKIELLIESGVTQVSIGGPLGPDPKETLRLFGEKVIPYFR